MDHVCRLSFCHRGAAPFVACSPEPHGLCARNTLYAVIKGREEKVLLLFVTFFSRIGVCGLKKFREGKGCWGIHCQVLLLGKCVEG